MREEGDDECWIVGVDSSSLLPRVTVEDGPQRGHTWLVDVHPATCEACGGMGRRPA